MHGSWMNAAPQVARRILRRPARLLRREVLPRIIPPASAFRGRPSPHIHVVGLLSSASGIGRSARLCIEMLRHAGYGVSTQNVAGLFASDDGIAWPAPTHPDFVPGGFCIYHLNPSMLLPGVLRAGLSRYYRSCNIGYWAWELETLPREWIAAIRYLNAILVPSHFCASAIRRYTAKPVVVVPHPVDDAHIASPPIVPNGRMNIVNVFRFGSSFERKNPIALVKAFRAAFGCDDAVKLTLKTSDGARYPVEMVKLRGWIGDQNNIVLIDEVWPEDRVAALMRSADVYASLHRSEGFGLPLAEAVMAGVPVVATDWSGNTDFCAHDHTYPVDYTLVSFRDGHGDYEQVGDARWAEPSIAHAAEQLRRVRGDLPAARLRAQAARVALRAHIEANGYQNALRSIADHAAAGGTQPAALAT